MLETENKKKPAKSKILFRFKCCEGYKFNNFKTELKKLVVLHP